MKKIITALSIMVSTFVFSQVGIGTNTPNNESILDIVSTTKGILIPRVDLTSTTLDLDGSNGNPEGMLVFNIGSTLVKGFYFWNGIEWRTVDNSTAVAPSIATLNCLGATLTPKNYTAGNSYTGVLQVPYTGGNGGSYSAGSTITVNGLAFTLQGGKLDYGTGSLIFNVSGIPTFSSPTPTTVAFTNTEIPFLTAAQNCSATVGNNIEATEKTTTVIGSLKWVASNGVNPAGWEVVATSPDGKYSIRTFCADLAQIGTTSIQIRPNTTTSGLTWNAGSQYRSDILVNAMNISSFPPSAIGYWCGTAGGNNNFTLHTSGQNAWADPGVGDGGFTEFRRFTWTNIDPSDKTMYDMNFMMGATNFSLQAHGGNCPSGECLQTKVYIRIAQISAN